MTEQPSPARTASLLGLLVALTIVGSSAVAVALPQVGQDLGLDTSGQAWVLASFSLSFSISTAVFGRVADLRGLRLPLRVGVVVFAAGSLAAASAPTSAVLIGARLLQGVGAGAVPVLATGIIAATTEGQDRGRALGALTGVVSLVSGCGPLIGGVLAQTLGWRSVFALPVVSLLLIRPVSRVAPSEPTCVGRLDVRGAVLVAVAVSGVVVALQSPSTGAGGPVLAAALVACIAAAAALRIHVRRRPQGLLPLAVVGNRALLLAAGAGLTLLASYLALLFAVPQRLAAAGASPLRVGLLLVPAALAGTLVSRWLGPRLERLGRARVVAVLGLVSAAGLALVAVAGSAPVPLVGSLAMAVMGFAGGQVALVDGIPRLVPEAVRGAALGVFNLVFFIGGAVGTATVGGLEALLGLSGALAVLAVLPVLGAVSATAAGRLADRRATTPLPS